MACELPLLSGYSQLLVTSFRRMIMKEQTKEQIKDWLDVILHPFCHLVYFFILMTSSLICNLLEHAYGVVAFKTASDVFCYLIIGITVIFTSYHAYNYYKQT
jgi:hypothetical protein